MFKIITVSCILAVVCVNLQTVEASLIPNPLSILNNVKDPASNVLGMANWNNKISENIQGEMGKISKKIVEYLSKGLSKLEEKNKELMEHAQRNNTSACCKTYDYTYIHINNLLTSLYSCITTEMQKVIENTEEVNGLTKKVQEIPLDSLISKVSNPLNMVKAVPNILKTMQDKDAFSIFGKVIPIAMKVQLFWSNLGTCLVVEAKKARDSQDRVIKSIMPCATSLLKL